MSRLETARQVPNVAETQAWADAAGASGDICEQLVKRVESALTETTSWSDQVWKGVAGKLCEAAMFDEDARDLLRSLAQEFLAE